MKLSVVIPTFNRCAFLERTLATIFNQDFPKDEFEVLVIIDGSTDGTAKMLKNLRPPCYLKILEQPNRGQSAAQNTGLHAARGQIVLFLDDDDLCDMSLLKEHVAAHEGVDPIVVFGPVRIAAESPSKLVADIVRAPTDEYYNGLIEKGPQWPHHAYVAPNVSGPRTTFLKCGGFDEGLVGTCVSILSDTDFGLRLWKMGIQFRYQPTAVVRHFYVKSPTALVKDAWWYGRNEVLLCRKHPDYRPYSGLASLCKGPLWKRLLRLTETRLPLSPEPLLDLMFRVCEKFSWIPMIRRLAKLLLGRRQAIVMLRSAFRIAGSWKALRNEFGMRLPVLLYHHVGPINPGTYSSLTVSPEQFEQQMNWLVRHGYVGILPSDWQAWRCEGKTLPEKPVLLTFDDAYADIATYALPVLRRHGFGAVVFAVTGRIGGTNSWDERRGSGTHQLMSRQQVLEWARQGIEFGAHSRTHANLTRLTDHELEDEIEGSGIELSKLLGVRATSFAYPYGTYNETTLNWVRRSFDLAFTVEEGLTDLKSNPYLIQRTMIQPSDSEIDLACRVRLGWSPLQHLRTRVRLRSRLKHAAKAICGRSR